MKSDSGQDGGRRVDERAGISIHGRGGFATAYRATRDGGIEYVAKGIDKRGVQPAASNGTNRLFLLDEIST